MLVLSVLDVTVTWDVFAFERVTFVLVVVQLKLPPVGFMLVAVRVMLFGPTIAPPFRSGTPAGPEMLTVGITLSPP